MYHAIGAIQDEKEAFEWYKLAAEQGHAHAQYNLGLMYNYGRGVPKNLVEAFKWYKIAAEQGDMNAQFRLALAYQYGEGVIQDNIYSHMWSNILAARGRAGRAKFRDLIAQEMTPSQIEKAQELARHCMKKEYKDC